MPTLNQRMRSDRISFLLGLEETTTFIYARTESRQTRLEFEQCRGEEKSALG
jgi:hypothetical protein